MGLKDRLGRLAGRLGSSLQDRVGGFVEDTLMTDAVKRLISEVEQDLAHGLLDDADRKLSQLEGQRTTTPRVKLLRGVVSLHRGDPARAVHHLEAALNQRQSAEVFYFLALALEQQQRWTEARNALLAALGSEREPPLQFELRFALGRVYLATGRHDRAVRELHRALKLRPGDEETLTMLAVVLRQQGQDEDALKTLREAAAGLQRAASWALLGQLEASAHQVEAATQAFDRALSLDPTQRDALEGAAGCALDQGQPARAKMLLQRLAEGGGVARFLEARLSLLDGRDDDAVVALLKVLDESPNHLGALLALGQVYLQQGQAEAASGYLLRALEVAPSSGPALRGLARARLALGDGLGAMRLIERLKECPEPEAAEPEARLLLAEVARYQGSPLDALVFVEEALGGGERREGPRWGELERLRAALAEEVRPRVVWPDAGGSAAEWAQALERCVAYMRGEPQLHPWLGVVSQLQAGLEAPLRVAIMGEFNAGKSTWINAYLGESVVPTGVLPTTAHLNRVMYGARRAARVVWKDGERVEEVAFEAVKGVLAREGEARVERVDFLYPHPQLRRVILVDTPGFNAVNEAHEALAKQALAQADAIVWLIDANQALSETQRQVLAQVEDGKEKTLIVLNKVDALDADEVAAVRTFLLENTEGLRCGIAAVSALDALRVQQKGVREGWDGARVEEALAATGWGVLLQTLEEELVGRSARLKEVELRRRLGRLVAEIEQTVGAVEARFGGLVVQLKGGIGGIEQAKRRVVERGLPDEEARLSEQLSLILTVVAREVEDARRPSAGWLSPLTLEGEDMMYVLDMLKGRVAQVLARSELRVREQVGEAVERMVGVLEGVARGLGGSAGRLLMGRLERFVAEEHLLFERLHTVYAEALRHLDGRLWLPEREALFARALGDEGIPESDRKQVLARWVGDLPLWVSRALNVWARVYFDASAALCDNVRRDVERLRLELKYRVWYPFEPLKVSGAVPVLAPEEMV